MEWNPLPIIHPFYLPQPDFLLFVDYQRSISLLQFIDEEGLVPTPEEERKRKRIINKLKQIVSAWIKKVAEQHNLPKRQIKVASATILKYGSYGLGVHSSESDIDALCAAPYFASIAEDFFGVLHEMLQMRAEVTDIQCVKSAKVPLMRFKFDGISIDLPFARLDVLHVPEKVDVQNPFYLWNTDGTSWKSLSGVCANRQILQVVPNIKAFQSMLRCLKLWAKRRGVYGALFGYLGGVHMAILAAFVCKMHRGASLNILILNFFQTFAEWPWPMPVTLQDGMLDTAFHHIGTQSFMPICLPSNSYQFCHSNITTSTFCRIKNEFLLGHHMTRSLDPNFIWDDVFKPFPYSTTYSQFLKICLSSSDQHALGEWVGWVKSRIRRLLLILEHTQGFCDPNPTEYVDNETTDPNVVFYWGLNPINSFRDTDLVKVKEKFMKIINNGSESSTGRMELSILLASHWPHVT